MAEPRAAVGRPPIHLAAYTDSDTFGGAEVFLATLLAFLDPAIRVTVIGTSRQVVEAVVSKRPGAGSVVVPPVRDKWNFRSILAHIRAMRRLRPDVCHISLRTPYACPYGLVAAFLTPGTRVVAVEQLPLQTGSPLRRWLKRRTSGRLAAHIAVGESAARLVERDADLRPGSIDVIFNAVPAQPVDGPPQRLAPGPVVGSVGRLEQQKGFDTLVDALVLLPDVTAVVVGEGTERSALEQRARERGVADRFIVTGWVDPVAPLLRGFDLFALPSRFEGLPLAILEAMEVGLAVVATDVGSVAESVTPDETGLLVPPDDPVALATAIRRLLEDVALRERLGRRGREVWAEKFTADVMAAAYERLYSSLVG